MTFDEEKIRRALVKSWSGDTAIQWSEDRPFDGQCNVTAAVVFELFGGDILKTPWNERTDHYYNRIGGKRYDLTDAQFDEPIIYADTLSSVEDASVGFTTAEYTTLKAALLENLGGTS